MTFIDWVILNFSYLFFDFITIYTVCFLIVISVYCAYWWTGHDGNKRVMAVTAFLFIYLRRCHIHSIWGNYIRYSVS